MASQVQTLFLKQITEVEPAGRLDSSSQDRLTALKAVTSFGAPLQVFDSEGECPHGQAYCHNSTDDQARSHRNIAAGLGNRELLLLVLTKK